MNGVCLAATILVALLGHDSFAVRERAERALPAFGNGPWIDWGIQSGDAERRVRCERVQARWAFDAADALLKEFDPLPYIDSLPTDFPNRNDLMSSYQARVLDVTMARYDPYPRDAAATAIWIRDEMINGADVGRLRALLKTMNERSQFYRKEKRWP